MVQSLSRIGRPPSRSGQRARLLLVQLRTAQDVNQLLRAATRLASPVLKAEWHTTSISIDRSPPEIEAHRKLMTELRRRQSQGEQVYLHNGKIISGHRQARQSDRPAANLSPLRVALPPLTNAGSTLSASAAPFLSTQRPLNPSQGN
jgi:N-formylglutamate amidohydrolase